ncbi:hypothetical protein H4Q26_000835 [Puccinia striiformis f. sp. tritici PST-130]|nr:hypothetical protein H4Q26_000835 [Puccinia striiformis f. sp. tritici PST-130]
MAGSRFACSLILRDCYKSLLDTHSVFIIASIQLSNQSQLSEVQPSVTTDSQIAYFLPRVPISPVLLFPVLRSASVSFVVFKLNQLSIPIKQVGKINPSCPRKVRCLTPLKLISKSNIDIHYLFTLLLRSADSIKGLDHPNFLNSPSPAFPPPNLVHHEVRLPTLPYPTIPGSGSSDQFICVVLYFHGISISPKRPAPLKRYSPSNLRLIGHEGSSASPLGTEQTSTDQHGVSPRSGSRPLSPLSQGIEEPLRLPVSQSRSQLARPNANLTPPATPNSREALFIQAKSLALLSKSNNPQLPPTPSTSPYQKAAPLVPTTVSAKALSAHKLHPVFTANYTLGDELGSGGFGFVVQATRNEDAMQCAVKFIYKEKVPAQAWVRDEHWEDESDTNGIMRTKDGAKRVPLEAYVLKTIRHRGVVAFVDLFEDNIYVYLVMEHHGTPWTASEKENKAPSFLKKLPTLLQPSPKKAPVTGGLKLEMASESRKSSLTLPPPMPGMMRRSSCDLFECIEQHSRLPERYAKYVFAQLVDVVGCLHYNGFVHRDIKDET